MKRISKYNLLILFMLMIIVVPIGTFAREEQTISDIENRTLATKPILTKESLFNGEYFSGWETYFSDHIIGRDNLIKSYTLLNMNILDKKKINDIAIGKNGELLPFYTETLSANFENHLNNIPNMVNLLVDLTDYIESYGGEFYYIGLPGQSTFFKDSYLDYFDNKEELVLSTEKNMFSLLDENNIKYVNMHEIFRNYPNENYYLKTDHHFTFTGAYKTYETIINTAKIDLNISDPIKLEEMDLIEIKQPILGSRNRQIYYLQDTNEKVIVANLKNPIEYTKYVNGIEDNRLYYYDENERPTYNTYMDGDKAEIVTDTNRPELPNLLIFGDSFTNALEPLLFYHFNQTRILDLRHYTELNIYEYIDKYKPDMVITVRDNLYYGSEEGNGNIGLE